jgi:hypothetical protein
MERLRNPLKSSSQNDEIHRKSGEHEEKAKSGVKAKSVSKGLRVRTPFQSVLRDLDYNASSMAF